MVPPALTIIETARLALATKLETLDVETTIGDALRAAARIIDAAAAELSDV